jgi:hypothetical protein
MEIKMSVREARLLLRLLNGPSAISPPVAVLYEKVQKAIEEHLAKSKAIQSGAEALLANLRAKGWTRKDFAKALEEFIE